METLVDEAGLRVGRLVTGPLDNNVYVVACTATGTAAIVDAAGDAAAILEAAARYAVIAVLTTHGHADHVGAAVRVCETLDVPFRIHPADVPMAGIRSGAPLGDGEVIPMGDLAAEVIHVPGHTPGSVCFRIGGVLLSGDTLFPGGPGATAGPSAFATIMEGLEERIFTLPDTTLVLPGHGAATTIGAERPSIPQWRARGW
jgi:glyoxylase-like metal-dependent hydrolase (beta-lactamase superfamily II)